MGGSATVALVAPAAEVGGSGDCDVGTAWRSHRHGARSVAWFSRLIDLLRKRNIAGGLAHDEALYRGWYQRARLLWPLQRVRLLGGRVTLGELLCAAFAASAWWSIAGDAGVRSSGATAEYALNLSIVLAARNSVFALLLGLPYDRALHYHKAMAWVAIALGVGHGWQRLVTTLPEQEAIMGRPWREGGEHHDEGPDWMGPRPLQRSCLGISSGLLLLGRRNNCSLLGATVDACAYELFDYPRLPDARGMPATGTTSGVVLLLVMVLMTLTACVPAFRRRYFELFLYTHLGSFFLVVVSGIIHGAGALGFAMLAVDYFIRYGLMSTLLPFCKAVGTPPTRARLIQLTHRRDDDGDGGVGCRRSLLRLEIPRPSRNRHTGST